MQAVQALYRIPYKAYRLCVGSRTGREGSVQDPQQADPTQAVQAVYRLPYKACRLCIGSRTGRVGFV
eukprot:3478148-Pyramimonas_sp.AAC.1